MRLTARAGSPQDGEGAMSQPQQGPQQHRDGAVTLTALVAAVVFFIIFPR